MKKLIIKTAILTVCGVLALICLLYGALVLFSPRTLVKFFDGLGAENLAKTYSEKQYEKTEDISDLYDLIVRLDTVEDSEKSAHYIKIMLESQGFEDFCTQADANGGKMSTKEYLSNKYVYALVEKGEYQKAIDFSSDFVKSYGYTEFNPLRTLFNDLYSRLDQEHKKNTRDEIFDARNSIKDLEQLGFIVEDILAKD